MGAEIGATTSLFGYDESMARFLRATERADVAELADAVSEHLTGDDECYANPEKYFDRVIEIDLSTLEPHVNGPYTPDLAWPISGLAEAFRKNNYHKSWRLALLVHVLTAPTKTSQEQLLWPARLQRKNSK